MNDGETGRRSDFVAALRALADDYEANEQMPLQDVHVTVFCDSLEEARARSIDGMERRTGDMYVDFRKVYAPDVYVELSVSKGRLYDKAQS
jgi:hypothetical protein